MKKFQINKGIFFLKNKLFRRGAYSEYKRALKNETLTKELLDKVNFEKRVDLLNFVYNYIPFYKKFYDDHNVDPTRFSDSDYWNDIPILEKKHIRECFHEILNPSCSKRDLIVSTTGGSTGKPLKVYRDRRFPEEIIKWRMLKRWGIHPGTDVAQFWRIPSKRAKLLNRVINKAIWWPTKRLSFDASSLNAQKMLWITEKINFHKPELFWGYVGALEQYAIFLEENDINLDYRPKCVWVTAAPLSKLQINLFKKKFTKNIIDQYACSEIHWVASNAPESDNLVIDYDYRHVDIVNENGEPSQINETGNILLTDLHNYAFPLIKYKVGDRAKFVTEKPIDAPGFQMMSPVKGRESDKIVSKYGTVISGEFLTTIFDDYTDEVLQFQIRQVNIETVIILVVALSEAGRLNSIFENVRKDLRQKTNYELNFRFKRVDKIKADRGKTRFVINELQT